MPGRPAGADAREEWLVTGYYALIPSLQLPVGVRLVLNNHDSMRKFSWLLCALRVLLMCVIALGSFKAAAKPGELEFEAASFKHAGKLSDGQRIEGGMVYLRPSRKLEYRGTRLSGEDLLTFIIQFAYLPDVVPYRSEGPPWLRDEFYSVEAIARKEASLAEVRLMLRRLLSERMGIKCHVVQKTESAFELTRSKAPLKVAPATGPDKNPGLHMANQFSSESATLSQFAGFLSHVLDRPVVDKTGLAGAYQFHVDWSSEGARPGTLDTGIVIRTIRELGFELKSSTQTGPVLVIAAPRREPTPN